MIELFDCIGRLACKGDPNTGLVECIYKGNKTSTILTKGESFKVERQGIITVITRKNDGCFVVVSKKNRINA